jgi:DNA-binding transcriptional MerR regulator
VRHEGLIPTLKPPAKPWVSLAGSADAGGFLSFYYSDSNSSLPARGITRPNDSKIDPNVETGTYGLFSTCQRGMRASVVRRGIETIFYCTNRGGVRALTGYYKIGWYAPMPKKGKHTRPYSRLDDFALAATKRRFTTKGFPLRDLTPYLDGERLDRRFRTSLRISSVAVKKLTALLDEVKDETGTYIDEIKRLEEENLKKHGFRYMNPRQRLRRRKPFSWEDASEYLN